MEKRRRNIPVYVTFKQFRHYLDVLKEGGEEQLRQTIRNEEPDEPPVIVTRRRGIYGSKVIPTTILEVSEQPTPDKGKAGGQVQASKPEMQVGMHGLVGNTKQVVNLNKSTAKTKFSDIKRIEDTIQKGLPKMTESDINRDMSVQTKVTSRPAPNSGSNSLPGAKNVLSYRLVGKPPSVYDKGNNNELSKNRPTVSTGHIKWISRNIKKDASLPLRSKILTGVQNQRTSNYIDTANAIALEKYLEGLSEKERAYLQKHPPVRRNLLDRSSDHQQLSGNMQLPSIPRPFGLDHFQKSKVSVETTASGENDDRVTVLPVSWWSRLVEEETSSLEEHVKRSKSSKSKRSSASSNNPNSSHELRPRKTSETASEHGMSQERVVSQRQDARRASLVHATSGLERRTSLTSTRRASLLPPDFDATSLFSSRRSSFPTDGRSVKSASSISSTRGSRGSRGDEKGRPPRLQRERSRIRLVYRADPPIPLRLYVNRKEKTSEKFVDGVTDEKGLPMLPMARRHIMTGLVYQKVSRSLIPPRPSDMRIPAKPPSTASSGSVKTLL